MRNSELLPKTSDPLVVRTDFENQRAWETICDLIRQPVREAGQDFYAYVEFLDNSAFRDLTVQELLARVPSDDPRTFLFVVDKTTTQSPDSPILVIDLHRERGRSFRAIPSQIQGIEMSRLETQTLWE